METDPLRKYINTCSKLKGYVSLSRDISMKWGCGELLCKKTVIVHCTIRATRAWQFWRRKKIWFISLLPLTCSGVSQAPDASSHVPNTLHHHHQAKLLQQGAVLCRNFWWQLGGKWEPGNFLEMQITGPHISPTEREIAGEPSHLCFNKHPRWFWCTAKNKKSPNRGKWGRWAHYCVNPVSHALPQFGNYMLLKDTSPVFQSFKSL